MLNMPSIWVLKSRRIYNFMEESLVMITKMAIELGDAFNWVVKTGEYGVKSNGFVR